LPLSVPCAQCRPVASQKACGDGAQITRQGAPLFPPLQNNSSRRALFPAIAALSPGPAHHLCLRRTFICAVMEPKRVGVPKMKPSASAGQSEVGSITGGASGPGGGACIFCSTSSGRVSLRTRGAGGCIGRGSERRLSERPMHLRDAPNSEDLDLHAALLQSLRHGGAHLLDMPVHGIVDDMHAAARGGGCCRGHRTDRRACRRRHQTGSQIAAVESSGDRYTHSKRSPASNWTGEMFRRARRPFDSARDEGYTTVVKISAAGCAFYHGNGTNAVIYH
jgi:hypothetical protein